MIKKKNDPFKLLENYKRLSYLWCTAVKCYIRTIAYTLMCHAQCPWLCFKNFSTRRRTGYLLYEKTKPKYTHKRKQLYRTTKCDIILFIYIDELIYYQIHLLHLAQFCYLLWIYDTRLSVVISSIKGYLPRFLSII